jgi:hypothetical protein
LIDEKYEGHTEGKWEYCDATIHATNKRGGRFKDNDIIAEYPCWNYNKDGLITKEEEANLRLMADAPLLLEEVKRLRKVLQGIRLDALVMMANGVENAYSIVLQAERGEEE